MKQNREFGNRENKKIVNLKAVKIKNPVNLKTEKMDRNGIWKSREVEKNREF